MMSWTVMMSLSLRRSQKRNSCLRMSLSTRCLRMRRMSREMRGMKTRLEMRQMLLTERFKKVKLYMKRKVGMVRDGDDGDGRGLPLALEGYERGPNHNMTLT
jgi:hypothetical protein